MKVVDGQDLILLAGLGLLAVGLWDIDWRLACIVLGLLLIISCVAGYRKG